jgi:hypothetical protein
VFTIKQICHFDEGQMQCQAETAGANSDATNLWRVLKHLLAPRYAVSRSFHEATLDRIEAAICASEALRRDEIRFAVEGGDLFVLLRGSSCASAL